MNQSLKEHHVAGHAYVLLRRALSTSFKLLQKEIRSSLTVLAQQQQQKNHKEKYTQWKEEEWQVAFTQNKQKKKKKRNKKIMTFE